MPVKKAWANKQAEKSFQVASNPPIFSCSRGVIRSKARFLNLSRHNQSTNIIAFHPPSDLLTPARLAKEEAPTTPCETFPVLSFSFPSLPSAVFVRPYWRTILPLLRLAPPVSHENSCMNSLPVAGLYTPNLLLEYDQWRRQQSLISKAANKRFHSQWTVFPSSGDGVLGE